jgi:hypothetical protein
MKGRRAFSTSEMHRIELALRDAARLDVPRRRRLLGSLRRHYRFYVSDYVSRGVRLTADDVERLIAQGVIRVYA